jgi:hypothetical protein
VAPTIEKKKIDDKIKNMRVSKKQKKIWVILVFISSLALILTSFIPVILTIIK